MPRFFDLRRIRAPAKDSRVSDRCAYVGEPESCPIPRARHDLTFPHFIDPPCYTNKLVATTLAANSRGKLLSEATPRARRLFQRRSRFRKSMAFPGARRPLVCLALLRAESRARARAR